MFATPLAPHSAREPQRAPATRSVSASQLRACTRRTVAPRRRRARRLPRRHVDLATQRPVARPPRLTRAAARRRRRLLLAASLVTGAFGCGLLSDALFAGSGGPAAAAPREALAAPVGAVAVATPVAPAPAVVVAESGDSLWSIAERFHGETPVSDYVARLVALNGGAAIRAGDVVVLPG